MLWYPYTQMKNAGSFPIVKSGKGVFLYLEDGRTLIDGISSWWSAIHGYNHPELNKALITQADSIPHVMMGGLSNRPAIELAKKLATITPEGLRHVFFSDSGSVAVEVALKMAFQFWINQGNNEKKKILSLKNGYHGDTFKAMEVSDDSDFSRTFSGILNKGYFLNTPQGGFFADETCMSLPLTQRHECKLMQASLPLKNKLYSNETTIAQDLEQLDETLREHHRELAAFILEPIVQCAGGFKMYSPLYLKAARELSKKHNVLLIFDEVATGFGRTGKLFASEHADVSPDIMIIGKALTAGYMGHAATITNSTVFNAFLDDGYEKAFMHGPTFMGNALACAVALRSIEIFEHEKYLEKIRNIEKIIKEGFSSIQSPCIKDKRVLGAIAAIEVSDRKHLQGFREFAFQQGVWLRPIDKVVYLMPPYIIQEKELCKLIDTIKKWFEKTNTPCLKKY